MMTYEQASEYVSGFSRSGESATDIVRFVILMKLLGNPHNNLKIVHVAGTNGKGSTCEYISAAAVVSGLTVGKFTSPYISCIEERIQVNNRNISRPAFALLCEQVKGAVEQSGFTGFSQFEILTAICFLYFYKEQVDLAIIETGIGGTLDCTNVVSPVLSVITSVDYDHTDLLGDTIAQIASHKAGIIKPTIPCVAAPEISEEAYAVIDAKCREFNCELIQPEMNRMQVLHMDTGEVFFSYKGMNYHLNMSGKHQIMNALCAIEACRIIGLEYSHVFTGLEKAVLPARMEMVNSKGTSYIIDGSHNPSAMKAAAELLALSDKPVYAVVGMLANKDWQGALDEILPCFKEVVFVDGFAGGTVKASVLAQYAQSKGASCVAENDIETALQMIDVKAEENGYAMITGSLYLASYVRKIIVK